jgi:uncharacterized cupredoxin-like copper-binding protein
MGAMMKMTGRWMLLIAMPFVLLAVACSTSNDASSPSTSGGTTSVDVELKDMAIIPETTSISAGSVTFDAHNSGPSAHEMVVLKTDLAADALPEADGLVDEEGTGVEMIGEIEEFASGLDESGTFDLTPGNYVLVCNIPGHYQSGMTIAVTVA